MSKQIIKITQKHIDEGIVGLCSGCPVALAVREQTKYKFANVATTYVDFDRIKLVNLPEEVTVFIKAFDGYLNKKSVNPFSFEIDVP